MAHFTNGAPLPLPPSAPALPAIAPLWTQVTHTRLRDDRPLPAVPHHVEAACVEALPDEALYQYDLAELLACGQCTLRRLHLAQR